jgi:hypothetical protein
MSSYRRAPSLYGELHIPCRVVARTAAAQDGCIPLRPPRQAGHGRRRPPAQGIGTRRTASRSRHPAHTVQLVYLFRDWFGPQGFRYQHGFSTRSGNDGKQPVCYGQTGHETGRLTLGQNGPSPGYTIGISAGRVRSLAYRTSSPVTVRPISIRWISDVPSKIVKIFASRCQRSTGYSRV